VARARREGVLLAAATHLRGSSEARDVLLAAAMHLRGSSEARDVLLAAAMHLRGSSQAREVLLAAATQMSRSGGTDSDECRCVHRRQTPYGGRRCRLGG
jgi:hypothetical protein